MFKSISCFQFLEPIDISGVNLVDAFEQLSYVPIGKTSKESVGWYPIFKNFSVVKRYEDIIIMNLMVETKSVPSGALKQELARLVDDYERKSGNKAGKAITKELKVEAELNLLPRAFSKQSEIYCWYNLTTNRLYMDATSESKSKHAINLLSKGFNATLLADSLTNKYSSHLEMKEWILADAPDDFTVDDECELVDRADNTPKVKYKSHDLNGDEIRSYLNNQHTPSMVRMTYRDVCSLNFTDKIELKSIKWANKPLLEDDAFIDTFFYHTREVETLLDNLISNCSERSAQDNDSEDE